MSELNQEYWENRYAHQLTGWDLGKVSDPIKEYVDQLKDMRLKILIPGAGNAQEASYLYQKGFKDLHILDLALHPLIAAKNNIPDLPKNSFIHQDFFKHTGSYDLIIEQTFFCALEPRFRESYIKQAHSLLKENGTIAGVMFNFENKQQGPPFGGSVEEYQNLFNPYFEIITMQPCYNSVESRMGKELFIKLLKKK